MKKHSNRGREREREEEREREGEREKENRKKEKREEEEALKESCEAAGSFSPGAGGQVLGRASGLSWVSMCVACVSVSLPPCSSVYSYAGSWGTALGRGQKELFCTSGHPQGRSLRSTHVRPPAHVYCT